VIDSSLPVGSEPDDPLARSDEADLAESAERVELEAGAEAELPLDVSEADFAEQARSALPGSAREVLRDHLPAEANEADVREQDLVVDIDQEDDR